MIRLTADQWTRGSVSVLTFSNARMRTFPASGSVSFRPVAVSSRKPPFNGLFRTLTPRLLLLPLSVFLLHTCVRPGPLIREELFPGSPTGTLVCVYSPVRMPPSHKFDMPFVAMVSPPLKYIYFCFWPGCVFFFYLGGLEPVAPRASFKCVWVFKDFSAEKLFGSQPHCHTSATELCHFRFLSHRWNQRKVQKRSKKHNTKADENGPDWIMSDLACASL